MRVSLFMMRLQALQYAIDLIREGRSFTVGGPMFPPYEELLRQAIRELLEVLDAQ